MPLRAYIGLPRQGKTYEVVTVVIFNALSQGRRVVSNIAGLDRAAMFERFVSSGGDAEKFGELVQVDHEQVLDSGFWLTDKPNAKSKSFLQPGDVLALDEIWRFWSGFGLTSDDGARRPPHVMNFFRMHGHFTHPETGYCCEIALITQDLADIHRSVRGIIEQTYLMTKLTSIGSSTRYRVDIFPKTRIRFKPLRSLQRSYNPDLFCFYKSHSQRQEGDAEAIEESPDKRGNLLASPFFRVVLPVLFFIVLPLAFWRVWSFFHSAEVKPVSVVAPGAAVAAHQPFAAQKRGPDVSETWRAVGYYYSKGQTVILLSDGSHVRGLSNPPYFQIAGLTVETFLPSGEAATSWTGGRAGNGVAGKVLPQ